MNIKQFIYICIIMVLGTACLVNPEPDTAAGRQTVPPPEDLAENLAAQAMQITASEVQTTSADADVSANASPEDEAASGPNAAQQALLASLLDYGLAPELLNDIWLNSPPLRLEDLRGKVVIVDFWTFG